MEGKENWQATGDFFPYPQGPRATAPPPYDATLVRYCISFSILCREWEVQMKTFIIIHTDKTQIYFSSPIIYHFPRGYPYLCLFALSPAKLLQRLR